MVIYPVVLFLALCVIPARTKADPADFNHQNPVIAIDPGHGGEDTGGAGSETMWEKDLTLLLAGQLADRLRPSYETILTRTGDYQLDLFERTATANHIAAEMLISLHAGGSFLHKAGGITIWYYQPVKAAFSAPDRPDTVPPLTGWRTSGQTPWAAVQLQHTTSSRLLAGLLQARLNKIKSFTQVKLNAAPLIVLEGADMPAVLIETEDLTNFIEKTAPGSPGTLSELTDAMAGAIDDFFKKTPPKYPDE